MSMVSAAKSASYPLAARAAKVSYRRFEPKLCVRFGLILLKNSTTGKSSGKPRMPFLPKAT